MKLEGTVVRATLPRRGRGCDACPSAHNACREPDSSINKFTGILYILKVPGIACC